MSISGGGRWCGCRGQTAGVTVVSGGDVWEERSRPSSADTSVLYQWTRGRVLHGALQNFQRATRLSSLQLTHKKWKYITHTSFHITWKTTQNRKTTQLLVKKWQREYCMTDEIITLLMNSIYVRVCVCSVCMYLCEVCVWSVVCV